MRLSSASIGAGGRGKDIMRTMIGMLIAASAASVAAAAPLPVGIAAQIPSGYEVLASAHIAAGQPVRDFEIVALGRQGEGRTFEVRQCAASPPRCLREEERPLRSGGPQRRRRVRGPTPAASATRSSTAMRR